MFKTKIIEKYYPPKKTLEMFNGIQFDIINGYARIIDKTNIKQVFPIVYKTNNLTIYEFINEEKSNKNFYIVENKKSYTREELKEILIKDNLQYTFYMIKHYYISFKLN